MTGHKGAALVLAVMAVALLSALGLSLIVITDTEMGVAANYAQAHRVRNAAEAGLELAVQELHAIGDWSSVAAGTTQSRLTDGLPSGDRVLSDGSLLNLGDLTEGLEAAGWHLFAYGQLNRLDDIPSDAYLVVWVRADPAHRAGVLALRADAFGPQGSRRAVQVAISPAGVLSWREVR